MRPHTYTQMHTDFTRTFGAGWKDCSPRCSEEKSGRRVRDAVLTGRGDTSLGSSTMRWSIFILRSAKWGHSGVPAEYIPHLHHESSAAYYSCPAQGGLAFIQRDGLCVRVCACAPVSMRARHLPKAPNEGIDTAHVTDREQVV